jgi:YHS domain-containing protein
MSTARSKLKILFITILIVLSIPIGLMLSYQGAPVNWGWWGPVYAEDGIAIRGYDAVSYFENSSAVMGSAQYSTEWKGVDWYFSSAANRSRFEKQPDSYAPQYGGYCATAISSGITFESDPQAWYLHDGKLYLFFEDAAMQDWLSKIEAGVITSADHNWASRTAKQTQ